MKRAILTRMAVATGVALLLYAGWRLYDLGKVRGGKRGQQQVAEAIAMESASRVLTRRTLERIKAIATGEYKEEEPEAKAEEKPKKASTSKRSGKSAEKKAEGETKAKKATSTKSAATKSKSTTKKTATKKTETTESE